MRKGKPVGHPIRLGLRIAILLFLILAPASPSMFGAGRIWISQGPEGGQILPGDMPTPGDYNGDGRTDIAVWRPNVGTWYILPSGAPGTYTTTQWGTATDMPVSGDYDGDGMTDIAVWRPGNGVWYVLLSGSPGTYTATQWGVATDVAISLLTAILR